MTATTNVAVRRNGQEADKPFALLIPSAAHTQMAVPMGRDELLALKNRIKEALDSDRPYDFDVPCEACGDMGARQWDEEDHNSAWICANCW